MKEKIQTYVQLYSNNVELNLSVTDDLKCQEGNLKNFGHISITSGSIGEKGIFWDVIEYFLEVDFKTYKKDCKKELNKAGYDVKQTFKDIKRLLKRAKKLKLLTHENNN